MKQLIASIRTGQRCHQDPLIICNGTYSKTASNVSLKTLTIPQKDPS